MPVTIKQPELEAKLSLLGRNDTVPVSKRALSHAILNAAVHAARQRRVPISFIIQELKATKAKRGEKNAKQ